MLGKIEDGGEGDGRGGNSLNGITDSRDVILSKLWEMERTRETFHAAVHSAIKSQTFLSD